MSGLPRADQGLNVKTNNTALAPTKTESPMNSEIDLAAVPETERTPTAPIPTRNRDPSLRSGSAASDMMEMGRELRKNRQSLSSTASPRSFTELRAEYLASSCAPLSEGEDDDDDDDEGFEDEEAIAPKKDNRGIHGLEGEQEIGQVNKSKIKGKFNFPQKQQELKNSSSLSEWSKVNPSTEANKSEDNDKKAQLATGLTSVTNRKGKNIALINDQNNLNSSIESNSVNNTSVLEEEQIPKKGVLSRTGIFSFLDSYTPYVAKLRAPRPDRVILESSKPISPKLYFANERTFLSWMQMCLITGSLAVGLIDFADALGRTSGIIFTVITIIFMFYALIQYHSRIDMIKMKVRGSEYEDIFGAAALIITVIIAAVLNLILKTFDNVQG